MLIFAGWLPPDLASSWGCLSLATGVRYLPYPKTRNEDSPYRDCAPDNIQGVDVRCFLPAPSNAFYLFINTDMLVSADSGALPSADSENGPLHIARRRNWHLAGRINHPLPTQICLPGIRERHFIADGPDKGNQFPGYSCVYHLGGLSFCS